MRRHGFVFVELGRPDLLGGRPHARNVTTAYCCPVFVLKEPEHHIAAEFACKLVAFLESIAIVVLVPKRDLGIVFSVEFSWART